MLERYEKTVLCCRRTKPVAIRQVICLDKIVNKDIEIFMGTQTKTCKSFGAEKQG